MSALLQAATAWYDAGVSLIPIRADGTKKPVFEWRRFMSERATPTMIQFWLDRNPGAGIGIVCGRVSGNLELLEIEGRACDGDSLARVQAECAKRDIDSTWDFLNSCLAVMSPSGGMHLIYRVEDHEIPGNTKIAERPATAEELAEEPKAKRKCLAETRGEGGYFVAAPSGGRVHETGLSWTVVAGQIGQIPTINWAERELLVEAVHAALDQMPAQEPRPQAPSAQPYTGEATRPGDAFNERADWREILEPEGWTISHVQGQTTFWVRPGKKARDGHSATTGHDGVGARDRLYVFSSSTEFDTETPYSKFAAYALLHHGGDYQAATKDLAAQGYGEKIERRERPVFNDFAQAGHAPVGDPQTVSPGPRDAHMPRARYCQTSVGNAERMVAGYAQDFRYIPAAKEWMTWDGRRWVADPGAGHVTRAITEMTYKIADEASELLGSPDEDVQKQGKSLYKWFTSSQQDAGMKATTSQFSRRLEVIATPDSFDKTPGLLNLPNGVYDLRAHKLLPHDRKYMATQIFGAAYDPNATCPKFEKLMQQLIPDEQMRQFVQRSVGYSLLGDPDQRAMFITHGPARTGKSQFHNLMLNLFGDYGGTAMAGAFHKVDKRGDGATPGLHALRNKRFVSTSEESEHAVLDTESLKRLTGNEAISTRALYQEGQRWQPQMVLWIATNPLPQLNSDDNAIWDRVKPVAFTTRFSARGDEGTIKETPGISDAIFAEEASGILNWALSGLMQFQISGGLNQPEQVDQGVSEYRHETDPVSQFVEEMKDLGQMSEAGGERVDIRKLYAAYSEWCRVNNSYSIQGRRFYRRLRSILEVTEFTKSNGRYYLPDWKWVPIYGMSGTM